MSLRIQSVHKCVQQWKLADSSLTHQARYTGNMYHKMSREVCKYILVNTQGHYKCADETHRKGNSNGYTWWIGLATSQRDNRNVSQGVRHKWWEKIGIRVQWKLCQLIRAECLHVVQIRINIIEFHHTKVGLDFIGTQFTSSLAFCDNTHSVSSSNMYIHDMDIQYIIALQY